MLLIDRILVHDDDDWTTLRFSICANCADLDLSELMIIDARNVHRTTGHRDDAYIIANNPTIGTTIYKSTLR